MIKIINNYKHILLFTMWVILWVLIWIFLLIRSSSPEIKQNNSTWTNVEIYTWEVDTWNNVWIEKPSNPRDLLDYQIRYWVDWVDYFISAPTDQPKMNWKTSDENNNTMWSYIHNNRISFDVKDENRNWYILFVMTNKPKWWSNIFLWVDGKTIWYLDKSESLPVENDNELLYRYDAVPVIWNSYARDENLYWKSINAVIAEQNNKIERIIVFFE